MKPCQGHQGFPVDTRRQETTQDRPFLRCSRLTMALGALPLVWEAIPVCGTLLQQHPVQSSSVTQSCPTLCDPMNHSTPGLPVHHQLLEYTQTHIHRVGEAIQPSHPLSSPSLPPPVPPSIRVFSNESTPCMRWPKYWSFSFSISSSSEYSGLISFNID